MTISESRHQRESTINTEIKTVSIRTVLIKATVLNTINGTTNSPSTRPDAARPNARIRITVKRVVMRTAKTPPAVDRSSLSRDF